ncbi:MAG: hypothetical protein ACLGHP_00315 [Vicinamibacteria bacterium]
MDDGGTDGTLIDDASRVARAVAARGGRALVVGGFVRDQLLGIASKDLDLEVFGVPEDDLRALLATLGRVEPVGQAFPVYKLGAIDVALPRRESKTGRGHKGFEVRGDPSMSFDEAARRRDFTINAIGWDPLSGEYLDPFDGRGDLARRVLRVVDPATFADDSLRVLRALQFAARFDLTVDEDTRAICRAILLDDLPAERIWGEMEKLLLQAPRPSIGFALARDIGVVERILPEMVPLYTCPQDPEWHPEGDVWTHTLMVIDEARARNADLDRPRLAAIMLGAVCHDLGKPETTIHVDGRVKSPGHEAAGVPHATRRSTGSTSTRWTASTCGRRCWGSWPSTSGRARSTRRRTRSPTARSEDSRRRWTWSCWRGSRAPTVMGARGRSTAARWTGSSSGHARSASSTARPRRS